MKRSVAALVFVVLASLALALPVALAASDTQIALRPTAAYPHARGSAQYQAQQTGQRELQIEVEHVASLRGKQVLFYVNGVKIGAARVGRTGKVELSRNTERGQQVPQVVSGTRVTVRAGTTVLSGSF